MSTIRDRYLLLGFFALTHLLLFYVCGVNTTMEAEKYLRQASLVLEGKFPESPKYYYYLPIIYLTAFAMKLHLGFGFVVFIQTLLSAGSLLLFYAANCRLFGRKEALIAGLLLCGFLPYFSWDFYLYSESLFFSATMVVYYLVARITKVSVANTLTLFSMLSILIVTRPFGVLFIPPLLLFLLLAPYRKPVDRWLSWCVSLAFLTSMWFVLNSIFHGGEDMDAMKPFVEEHIVCFVPRNPAGAKLDLRYYDNGLRDIFYYIAHNPVHFVRLMIQRLWSFFSVVRPWYSTVHNVFLAAFLIPVYTLFATGLIVAVRKWKRQYWYFAGLLVCYPLAVTFQCDDWHARFTMPMLPIIFSFAALAVTSLTEKCKKYFHPRFDQH